MNIIDREPSGQMILFPVRSFGARPKPDRQPPAHAGSDTSQAAAQAVAGKVRGRKELALRLIQAAGEKGLTAFELAAASGWLIQSVTPLCNRLAEERHIVDSGRRRNSPSGSPAKVWIATRRAGRD